MNAVVEEVQPWSRVHWAIAISIAVAIQLALVLAFTNRGPLPRRLEANTGVVIPAKIAEEFEALSNPTLLALGGPRSFSAIWLGSPQLLPVDANWKQAPRWLNLNSEALGDEFIEFAKSSAASLNGPAFKPVPVTFPPTALESPKPLRTASSLQVGGELATRRLLHPPKLRSWPATDLLLPSKVRVVVDVRGVVISAILQSTSGSDAADQVAVKQARRMRFSPLPHGTADQPLTLGHVSFEWHATHTPDNKPQGNTQ